MVIDCAVLSNQSDEYNDRGLEKSPNCMFIIFKMGAIMDGWNCARDMGF